jgi:formiminoglutamase
VLTLTQQNYHEKYRTFTPADLLKYTKQRSGEIKFGERIITVPKDADPFEFKKF